MINDTAATEDRPLRLGLIINPRAGIGGPLGQKGSDDYQGPAGARSQQRAVRALSALDPARLHLLTYPGPMGAVAARAAGLVPEVVGSLADAAHTDARDTRAAVAALLEAGVDLLLFVGGDGTARDIVDALGERAASQPVLGIPAGVKMHSGVFALSPEGAGTLLQRLLDGGLVTVASREVRDIDEAAFRAGQVRARHYGELLVPEEGQFLQQVKVGGIESEELVLQDIAAEIEERMADQPQALVLMGPGSTTAAIMDHLGLANTLLGVDVLAEGRVIAADADGPTLERLLAEAGEVPAFIVLTAIGGQGHLLGRGNQQFTPAVLRRVGRDGLWVVATKTKLTGLGGRPLLLDSNDPALDRDWAGLVPVITGYHDTVLYPLAGAVGGAADDA